MSDLNTQAVARYKNNFLKEVEERVEEGTMVKMCMQCGVCAGSCPLGPAWAHPPQEIFMMIRAGKREEVLGSDSMWMCTSCYNCMVRCPRQLPITHIMHGLANYAHRLGIAPKQNPTRRFAQMFWKGPIAWNGLITFYVTLIDYAAWLGVMMFLILRALSGQQKDTQAQVALAPLAARA